MSNGDKVKTRKPKKIKRKNEVTSGDMIPIIKEKLKQIIQLKAQCIRKYEKCTNLFKYNKIFQDDPKKIQSRNRKRNNKCYAPQHTHTHTHTHDWWIEKTWIHKNHIIKKRSTENTKDTFKILNLTYTKLLQEKG